MNEKFKSMITECYRPYAVEQVDYEKFAGLIIDDVLKIMSDPVNYNRCVYTTHDADQAACVAIALCNKIKEHFKVTE